MALQMADAACEGLAARVASAAAPSRRRRSALPGAQSSCGACLRRAVNTRGITKAACTQQLHCLAALEEDAVVLDDKELTANTKSSNRRPSFSGALASQVAADGAQVSEPKRERPHASAFDAMHGSREDLKESEFGDQQPQDTVTRCVCDACGKRYTEDQYHDLATICTCNHMITLVEGGLPESTAADADRPKPAKRRRVPERTKTPSSLPRTNSAQSEPSHGADTHEVSSGLVGAAATASPQVAGFATTLPPTTGLEGKRVRGCSKAKAFPAHAETSTPQQRRELAQKSQPPQQQSQELAKKRGRPPKPTLEKVSAAVAQKSQPLQQQSQEPAKKRGRPPKPTLEKMSAAATVAASQTQSLQSPQIPAQQFQVVEPQRKLEARAKASKKLPTPGAGKSPTTPQHLPRGLPKAAQRYVAMKPRARNQYLKGLSNVQQLRLAMQLSEAGANPECY